MGIIAGLGLAMVLCLVLTVLFSTSMQRAIALQAMARHADEVELEGIRLSPSLSVLELTRLRVLKDGVEIELESALVQGGLLNAALGRAIALEQVEVKGLIVDLTNRSPALVDDGAKQTPVKAKPDREAIASSFEGLLTRAHLPLSLTVDEIGLDARVLLPNAQGIQAQIHGQGIAPGARAALDIVGTFTDDNPQAEVKSMALQGAIEVGQGQGNAVSEINLDVTLAATSARFETPAQLHVLASVQRSVDEESYVLAINNKTNVSNPMQVFTANGVLDLKNNRLTGEYRINTRTEDVQPFAMNIPIPQFALMGEGQLALNAGTGQGDLSAQLQFSGEGFEVVDARLASLGHLDAVLNVAAGFTPETYSLQQCKAQIKQGGTTGLASLTVELLAPVAVNAQSFQTLTEVPEGDILAIQAQQLPLAWIDPWVDEYSVLDGSVSAGLQLAYAQNAWQLNAVEDLRMASVKVSQGEQGLVDQLDVTVRPSVQLQGTEVRVSLNALHATHRNSMFLQGDVAAQLDSSPGEMKLNSITCDLQSNLAVLNKEFFANNYALRTGDLALTGSYHLHEQERGAVSLQGALTNLTANNVDLGEITKLTVSAQGTAVWPDDIKLNMPVKLLGDQGVTDCVLAVSWSQDEGQSLFDVAIGGESLIVDDVLALKDFFAERAGDSSSAVSIVDDKPVNDMGAEKEALADAEPLWAGYQGRVAIDLGRLSAFDHEFNKLQTTFNVKPDALEMKSLQGNYFGAEVEGNAHLTYSSQTSGEPYALVTQLSMEQLDTQQLLLRVLRNNNAQLSGLFDVQLDAHGRGPNVQMLFEHIQGNFDIRGGKGSLVLIADKNKLRGLAGIAGIGQFLGKAAKIKEMNAVLELVGLLENFEYDQVYLKGSRDSHFDIEIQQLLFSGPHMRLQSRGKLFHQTSATISDYPVRMQTLLSAQGNTAELFDKAGWISGEVGKDGFYPGPTFAINGTLGNLNYQEIILNLVQEAVNKKVKSAFSGRNELRESEDKAEDTERQSLQRPEVEDVVRGLLGL